jgi:hypothetical protein
MKTGHPFFDPRPELEDHNPCPEGDCPIDLVIPRIRYLLHSHLGEPSFEGTEKSHKLAHELADKMLPAVNAAQATPDIVAHACLVIMELACKRLEELHDASLLGEMREVRLTPKVQ